jgi:hypothetical protein
MAQPHVVILGGGFGGLTAARTLAKAPVRVTLIDRRNHHLFQPLLYQVATAALNPSDIAYPIRAVLAKQANARVLLADARGIDPARKVVTLDDGELAYDYLVVATGATHSYFGHDDWSPHAPGLKSIEDALEIRRRVFLAYEAAEREADPAAQAAWLRFVVVGAGPTGVELAGALGEIGLHTLAKDFRTIDPTRVEVLLIEGNPRVLGGFAAVAGRCRGGVAGPPPRHGPLRHQGDRGRRRRRRGAARRRPTRAHRGAHGAVGGWRQGLAAGGVAGRAARRRRPGRRSTKISRSPAVARCSSSATWRPGGATASRSPACARARSRAVATSRAMIRADLAGRPRRAVPLQATRAPSRRSAGRPRWRRSARAATTASSRGSCGG